MRPVPFLLFPVCLSCSMENVARSTDRIPAAFPAPSPYPHGPLAVGSTQPLQIINAFPLEGKGAYHGLSKFKSWVDGFDPVLDQVRLTLLSPRYNHNRKCSRYLRSSCFLGASNVGLVGESLACSVLPLQGCEGLSPDRINACDYDDHV